MPAYNWLRAEIAKVLDSQRKQALYQQQGNLFGQARNSRSAKSMTPAISVERGRAPVGLDGVRSTAWLSSSGSSFAVSVTSTAACWSSESLWTSPFPSVGPMTSGGLK